MTEAERLVLEGRTSKEIEAATSIQKTALWRIRKRLGIPCPSRTAPIWDHVQQYYDLGHTVEATRKKFGIGGGVWNEARKNGVIRTRQVGNDLQALLVEEYTGR